MEGMKPRIKSMIWNTKKTKIYSQNSKKKNKFKKMRIDPETSGTSSNVPTSVS